MVRTHFQDTDHTQSLAMYFRRTAQHSGFQAHAKEPKVCRCNDVIGSSRSHTLLHRQCYGYGILEWHRFDQIFQHVAVNRNWRWH
jgi:hypothetical protein